MSEQNIITTIEDNSGYRSTLAYILLTDEVDGISINDDYKNLSYMQRNRKIKKVVKYTFRRRVIDEIYGPDVSEGDLSEKPAKLTDEQWRLVLKRADKQWDEHRKYIYPFEHDKYTGFFETGKSVAVDMFMSHYQDEHHEDVKGKIKTTDGRVVALSGGLLNRIEKIFDVGNVGTMLTEEMKKESFGEHVRRADRDLYLSLIHI